MLLSILIPTRNRSDRLHENLCNIATILQDLEEFNEVEIIISDNASDKRDLKKTREYVKQYPYAIRLNENSQNLGIEKNCLLLLDMCKTEYGMLLGDDDFFDPEFLRRVLGYVREGEMAAIVPNFFKVDGIRRRSSRKNRDKERPDKLYKVAEYPELAAWGHQLSGLTFKIEGTAEAYRSNVISNLYPMVYFIGYNIMRGPSVHITEHPLENTVIPKKNFDYGFDNLMGDISRSMDALEISNDGRRKLFCKRFAKRQTSRYLNQDTMTHPRRFIKKVKEEYRVSAMMQDAILRQFILGYIKVPLQLPKRLMRRILRPIFLRHANRWNTSS